MTVVEILESVQYVVDGQGRKMAVQFELSAWKKLLPLMEEVIKDGRLAKLIEDVADDEHLEEADALKAYQAYLSEV